MSTFFLVSYIISLSLSLTTFFIGIYVGKKRLHTVRILPKALRLFLISCCFPYFFLTSICSTYISIFYLTYNTQTHYTVEIVRNIITFSSQQIRNSFILIIFERIIFTIRLEKHTVADREALLWFLTAISYVTSICYLTYNIYSKSMVDKPWLYNLVHYYAYGAHLFMFSGCAVLYMLNRKMYKISAYRISLKRRCAIAQNVKSMRYLFPTVLVYTLCAQFGSMTTIIFQALNLPTPPVCIFHIFFNLAFLSVYFRHCCIQSDQIMPVKNVTIVKNALGNNIPLNASPDQYFNDLQHQWK